MLSRRLANASDERFQTVRRLDGLFPSNELHSQIFRLVAVIAIASHAVLGADLEPIRYHHPGLKVDLGVGLYSYPMPVDFDQDGDMDLVLSCPDKPFNGTYFCENAAGPGIAMPVFRAPRRISRGVANVQLSWQGNTMRVVGPGVEYPDFLRSGLDQPQPWPSPSNFHRPVGKQSQKTRANQWQFVDFDADGDHDLIAGVDDWSDYGWDDAFDSNGKWTNGPLHGFVYLILNEGSDETPNYRTPQKLTVADGKDIDVYGWPSPNLKDFDGDGDLDLICGEFLDGLTYFENLGTRQSPSYATGRPLMTDGKPLRMDLEMILPVSLDWDSDGDIDLIVGDEDGRVALVRNGGQVAAGMPLFESPQYFQQEADLLKCGALATPCGFDWDGDGDQDIVSGNTAGYLEWFENLGQPGDAPTPRFAAPRQLQAEGKTIRIQAGYNGSIQGPCEAKWGYTTLCIADWDHDELPDIMINSIWGRIQWFRNVGTRNHPLLAGATDVQVAWLGDPLKPEWTWWTPTSGQLVTQWRTTPAIVDWNRDGLNDLILLDHEGYLSLFQRERRGDKTVLLPGRRIFYDAQGNLLRLNEKRAGGSGRRKLTVVDWDQDGYLDLLIDGTNVDWYRQTSATSSDHVTFTAQGALAQRDVSSHSPCPTIVDWNRNGIPDLLVGAEDGHFYYMAR